MQILHRGFAATHEVAEWAEGRTETSAPDQMVVVELAQTIEDGGSAERAGIAELTEMRKRDNVPEVRAGIATENPAAAASANEQTALQPTPNNAKRHQRPALHV